MGRFRGPRQHSSGMSLDEELALAGGVLRCRDHPDLRSAISRAVQRGRLLRPVPGVVVVSALADDPLARLRVAGLWRPGDPLCLDAAAHLAISPRALLPRIVIAGRAVMSVHGFEVRERRIRPEWITTRHGLAITDPSLTVADQLAVGFTSDLHDGLRRRVVSLGSVRAALDAHAYRHGNLLVRRQLWLARENPWSDGEAVMHEVFRTGHLIGWHGNAAIHVGNRTFYGDAVFTRARLIVELDGRDHHSTEVDQRADRARRNALTAAGWRVLVLTMDMLLACPDETVAMIRDALTRGRRRQ